MYSRSLPHASWNRRVPCRATTNERFAPTIHRVRQAEGMIAARELRHTIARRSRFQ